MHIDIFELRSANRHPLYKPLVGGRKKAQGLLYRYNTGSRQEGKITEPRAANSVLFGMSIFVGISSVK